MIATFHVRGGSFYVYMYIDGSIMGKVVVLTPLRE